MSDILDLFTPFTVHNPHRAYPPANAYNDGDALVVELAVAGFSKEDLEVGFDGSRLVVTGKSNAAEAPSDRVWHLRQLSARPFTRVFTISGKYQADSVELENGLLTITFKNDRTKQQLEIVDKNTGNR